MGVDPKIPVDEEPMKSEPRSLFLIVRSQADLKRACEEVVAYLSILRGRSDGRGPEVLQGIWIDAEGAANPPSALVLPDGSGIRRCVRLPEIIGITGIWMLCWLEAAARTVSRADLVAALLEHSGRGETDTVMNPVHFIPVFTGEMDVCSTREESRVLGFRYPGRVLPPAYLDGEGALSLPQAHTDG